MKKSGASTPSGLNLYARHEHKSHELSRPAIKVVFNDASHFTYFQDRLLTPPGSPTKMMENLWYLGVKGITPPPSPKRGSSKVVSKQVPVQPVIFNKQKRKSLINPSLPLTESAKVVEEKRLHESASRETMKSYAQALVGSTPPPLILGESALSSVTYIEYKDSFSFSDLFKTGLTPAASPNISPASSSVDLDFSRGNRKYNRGNRDGL